MSGRCVERAAIAILVAVLIAGCAGRGSRVAAEPALKHASVEQFDASELEGVIVPGRRVGRLTLGMSEAQVRELLGRPLQTQDSDAHRIHEYPELSVVLERRTSRVEMLVVPGLRYKTEKSIAVGSSESQVRAAYGEPAKQTGGGSTFVTACYGHGLVFNYHERVVDTIVVRTPGC
jgi:hypothetical protein